MMHFFSGLIRPGRLQTCLGRRLRSADESWLDKYPGTLL